MDHDIPALWGLLDAAGADEAPGIDLPLRLHAAGHVGAGVGRVAQDGPGLALAQPHPGHFPRPALAVGREAAVPERPDHPAAAPGRLEGTEDIEGTPELEPALAQLHACDERGFVAREPREKFALFFIGWLGGPQDYTARYGHPRLRMRHAHVPVDQAMADAWMRCMKHALDLSGVASDVRDFVVTKLHDVALHMRNRA